MKYPDGACRCCGERLFGHVDGGYACHNCGTRYPLESKPETPSEGTELQYFGEEPADEAPDGVEFRYDAEESAEAPSAEIELRRSSGE
jgi:hypothetical protein